MRKRNETGCNEYQHLASGVSRRRFLGWSAGLMATAATPAWLPRVVLAQSDNLERDVLVSIFLRGGADGLSLCVPYLEPNYYQLRPTLAIAPPDSSAPFSALDLDGQFGLAPAMRPLLDAYGAEDLLIVHACGQHAPTRSHFAAMNLMEVGSQNPPGDLITGWLGRHLANTAPTVQEGALRALALGFGLPRTLVGGPRTLPIPDPSQFDLGGDPATLDARRDAVAAMYDAAPDPLNASARATRATVDLLHTIDFAGYQPADGTTYPESELGRALQASAALIRAEVGVEAMTIDSGGWDTHDLQGPVDGVMASLMGDLASSLAAFHADLRGSGTDRVTTVVMTEFGRNVIENGSEGVDHGHGGVMMVLGAAISGGRVLAEWPGLEHDQLHEQQDLAVTIDYRDVLSEIITGRLTNPDWATVFPDPAYTPEPRGVLTP